MLITKPERRLTAAEALDHKWFKRNLVEDKQKWTKIKNVGGLSNIQHYSKMQQAAMTAIAVFAGPDDIREMKEIFLAIDKNGDGRLSFGEIERGLKRLKLENRDELLDVLKLADIDGSGYVEYTEFIAATLESQIFLKEEYLKNAFEMFDTDHSGKIDNDELMQILQGDELKYLSLKENIKNAIKEVDANNDGEIDFEEFKAMMKLCNV